MSIPGQAISSWWLQGNSVRSRKWGTYPLIHSTTFQVRRRMMVCKLNTTESTSGRSCWWAGTLNCLLFEVIWFQDGHISQSGLPEIQASKLKTCIYMSVCVCVCVCVCLLRGVKVWGREVAIIKQNAVCILAFIWPFIPDWENNSCWSNVLLRAEDECTDQTWFVLRRAWSHGEVLRQLGFVRASGW